MRRNRFHNPRRTACPLTRRARRPLFEMLEVRALLARFEGLGHFPDAVFGGHATGVSAYGSTVVGYASRGTEDDWYGEGFRWTRAGGFEGLGHLDGDIDSYAGGVSGDGSIVVGYSLGRDNLSQAFR